MAEEAAPKPPEALYGGYSRFELELEFVQSLANPDYLQHLAVKKYLRDPNLIAYLEYLQYFREPQYIKYLTYPGPTLKALELLQQAKFREEMHSQQVALVLKQQLMSASNAMHS